MDDCCSNVRQIEAKIEEQLDRSGQTQELLRMLYENTTLVFTTEGRKVGVKLRTETIRRAEENVDAEKVARSLEF